jgi:hypothetical protein
LFEARFHFGTYNDQIITLHQQYEWAQSSIHNLSFDFVIETQYKQEDLLSSQFATPETVRGTQQLHAFMPVKKGILYTKIYSASNYTENHVVSVLKDMIVLKDITGCDMYV